MNRGAIAVLATYGYAEVKVIKQPSVAVIATGSELLDVNDVLEDGKIRNSNGPMIRALAEKLGLEVGIYKTQQDDLDSGIQVVKEAMEKHDIVITTGGVSVGDFDYLPEIYKAVKAEALDQEKVAMRPGSVTTVAFADGKYLFGLSGNPSACFTGFELFVKPAVKHMCGALEVFPKIIKSNINGRFYQGKPIHTIYTC
ncbi:molybdenum cofactor synthesis domain-containing protein [Staphylococcus aureus]